MKKRLPQARHHSKKDIYQGSDRTDLLKECNELGLSENEFQSTFCQRCKNHSCERSGWGWSSWEERISTQEDRFLVNPKFANPLDGRFERVREQDFPMLMAEAIRQNSGHGWDVAPPEIVLQPQLAPIPSTPPTETQPPDAKDPFAGVVIGKPIAGNTPFPPEGRMVGPQSTGSAKTSGKDLWDVGEKKVKVGAVVRFGS